MKYRLAQGGRRRARLRGAGVLGSEGPRNRLKQAPRCGCKVTVRPGEQRGPEQRQRGPLDCERLAHQELQRLAAVLVRRAALLRPPRYRRPGLEHEQARLQQQRHGAHALRLEVGYVHARGVEVCAGCELVREPLEDGARQEAEPVRARRCSHFSLRDGAGLERLEDGEGVEGRRDAVEAVAVVPVRELRDGSVGAAHAQAGRQALELPGEGGADLGLAEAEHARQQRGAREVGEVVGAREERGVREASHARDEAALNARARGGGLCCHHERAQRLDPALGGGPIPLGNVLDDGIIVLVNEHRNGHAERHCAHEDAQRAPRRARQADLGLERVSEGSARDARDAVKNVALKLGAR